MTDNRYELREIAKMVRNTTYTFWIWGWMFTIGYIDVVGNIESLWGKLFVCLIAGGLWPLFLGLELGGAGVFVP